MKFYHDDEKNHTRMMMMHHFINGLSNRLFVCPRMTIDGDKFKDNGNGNGEKEKGRLGVHGLSPLHS